MTRFARAKGSKASNERIPEEATSWQTMKEQLEEKKREVQECKKRKEFEDKRKENYKNFLEEKENERKPEWAEFQQSSVNIVGTPKGLQNKNKRKISEGSEIEEDQKLNAIISKIEKVLEKQEKEETPKKKKKKGNRKFEDGETFLKDNEGPEENGLVSSNIEVKKLKKKNEQLQESIEANSDDDAPQEISAKITPTAIKVKAKAKSTKKTPLLIPSINVTDENVSVKDSDIQDKPKAKSTGKNSLKNDRKKENKAKPNKKSSNEPKPKKPVEELTEGELKRLNRNKAKRLRQLANKKLRKALEREAKAAAEQENQPKTTTKRKLPKIRDNEEHNRRKPDDKIHTMNINGINVEIDYYDGFPIKKGDAERLRKLRKEMISKGIPKSEVQTALKLERRKAEKALAREKKKVCFSCRKSGHNLSECPSLNENSQQEMIGTGICFKCGSTEHSHFECKVVRSDNFKYATCFICHEQGHISRQCPDNQKGLYPKGGACRVCGDVTHLKKDCPKFQTEQESQTIKLDVMSSSNIEGLENERINKVRQGSNKLNKVVKF